MLHGTSSQVMKEKFILHCTCTIDTIDKLTLEHYLIQKGNVLY